jgi:hypothetical protein
MAASWLCASRNQVVSAHSPARRDHVLNGAARRPQRYKVGLVNHAGQRTPGDQQRVLRPLHPNLLMEPRQCDGALTPGEIQTLEAGTELRLYTCAACGKRNLYPIKDPVGIWGPEPHRVPTPRLMEDRTSNTKR